jgi:zinc transporter ZupT
VLPIGNENHFHLWYLFAMNTAIILAASTAIATTTGGYLAIKSKDRLHLVLGLSAGLLLGLVAFDLLPEIFELDTQEISPRTSCFHCPNCWIFTSSLL